MKLRVKMERIEGRSQFLRRRFSGDSNLICSFLMISSMVMGFFHEPIDELLNMRNLSEHFIYSVRLKIVRFWISLLRFSLPEEEENNVLSRSILNLCRSQFVNPAEPHDNLDERITIGRYIRYGSEGWIRTKTKIKVGSKVVDPKFGVVGIVDLCEGDLCHIGPLRNGYRVRVRGKKVEFDASLILKNDRIFLRIVDESFPEPGDVVLIGPNDPDFSILKEMGALKIGYVVHPPRYTKYGRLFPLDLPKVESKYLVIISVEDRGS